MLIGLIAYCADRTDSDDDGRSPMIEDGRCASDDNNDDNGL